MYYVISEGKDFYVKNYGYLVDIKIDDFYSLINIDSKKIVEMIFKKDLVLENINFPDYVFDMLSDYILNNIGQNELIEKLIENKIPLYSIVISTGNDCRNKYKALCMMKNADKITFKCNKDNLFKVMSIIHLFNAQILIDSTDISLEDYRHILSSFDFKSIENLDVKVNYQEHNTYLTPKALYDVSSIICNISEEIKKYNLSPFEQVMYAYDIVKNRKYKECESNKRNSRDLDKVLLGDAIVCVGYSRFLNAILKCLDINAIPLIDLEKHHQRSLVYVKDFKYNIDGVYAFDPTLDRRTSDDEEYIDNYNAFATSINLRDDNIFGDILKTICMDFDDIVKIINSYSFKNINKLLDDLEVLFKLTNNNDFVKFVSDLNLYEVCSNDERKIIRATYLKLLSKFTSKDISIETFTKVLYNTRRIQYYNNVITDFNVNDVFRVACNRFTYLYKLRMKKEEDNYAIRHIMTQFYNDKISKRLENKGNKVIESSFRNNIDVSRDRENVRLLKVLRNRQKQLTENKK